MTRYAMSIDLDRCVGCQACVVACKAENDVADPMFRLTVSEQAGAGVRAAVTSAHAQCFHCEAPACVALCPSGATFKDSNGVVRLDREKCINCGNCVSACPYSARHYGASAGAVEKCDFCAHRLEDGLLPACVDVCPTDARLFGDLDRTDTPFARAAGGKDARVFRPELGLKPKLFYVAKNQRLTDLSMAALPERASTPLLAALWSGVTRPLSGFGTALAAAVTLLALPVAWRNARLHAKSGQGDGAGAVDPGRQAGVGAGQAAGSSVKHTLEPGALLGAPRGQKQAQGVGQKPLVPGQVVPGPVASQREGHGAGRKPAGPGHAASQRPAVPGQVRGTSPAVAGPASVKKPVVRKGEANGHSQS